MTNIQIAVMVVVAVLANAGYFMVIRRMYGGWPVARKWWWAYALDFCIVSTVASLAVFGGFQAVKFI